MSGCESMEIATSIPASDTLPTCCGVIYGLKLETTGATWGNTAKYLTNREIQRKFNLDNMRQVKGSGKDNSYDTLAANASYDLDLTEHFSVAMSDWNADSEFDAFLTEVKNVNASSACEAKVIFTYQVIIKCEFTHNKRDTWDKHLKRTHFVQGKKIGL